MAAYDKDDIQIYGTKQSITRVDSKGADENVSNDGITSVKPQSIDDIDDIDPKEERAFVWRLDMFFLTIGFLGYMFKYIDQTNISNAYVSGMKEDLKLYGNQLNYFTTYFNIGYMVILYPSCIIISYIGPSVWLPSAEIIWGVLTCCLSTVHSAKQVYGLRFLIGLAEGTTWPGYFTIISQWYLPHEIALRMSLYNMAQPAGAMLSGAMQGALSTNLQGALGRAGWRWAFLINGICTIFIALVAYTILPGFPERPNPLARFYLKDRHIKIALARARRVGRKPQKGITIKSFARAFTFWQFWAVAIAWPIGSNTQPTSYFNLWLKSLKNPDGTATYNVGMLNYLPIIGNAAQLVWQVVVCGLSDYYGRLPFLLLHSAVNIASLIILIIRPTNRNTYMAGWYLDYLGAASTMLLCSWAAVNLQEEPEVRTILFASGTLLAYLLNAFVPIAAYPASEAPNWHIGAKVYLGFAVAATLIFIGIDLGFRWEARRKARKEIKEDTAGEPDNVHS